MKNGERGAVSAALPEAATSFRLKDIFTPTVALDVRLKFYEVLVALLILIFTIFVGVNANIILSRQNAIVGRSGRQQYHAELLQGYISSIQKAAFDTEENRRMLHLSLDLYGMLWRLSIWQTQRGCEKGGLRAALSIQSLSDVVGFAGAV